MCKIINAKQVMGSILMELLQQDKKSISIKNIFRIENVIDMRLRREVSAIIAMSIEDIYQVIESYENIISLGANTIYIRECDYELINMKVIIEDYFLSGIPDDIAQVMSISIKECFENEK